MTKKRRWVPREEEFARLKEVAKKFIIKDQVFDEKGWGEPYETDKYVVMDGVFIFKYHTTKQYKINFQLKFPKHSEHPHKEVLVKFPVDHKTRHIVHRHKIKDYIYGLYYEKIHAPIIIV